MKKKRKNILRLFGYDWKLIVNSNECNMNEGGSFSWKDKTIKINNKYGEGKSILLHEIIEAILIYNMARYYGNEGNQEYHFFFNHTQFTKIVCDIYTALKDNKLI